MREEEARGSVETTASQTLPNTEPTELRQRARTWAEKAVLVYRKINQLGLCNSRECPERTFFLQSDSHYAVFRRQIQRSLSLCVPTTPISPKVQKKIHNVGSSSSNCSMERTVPPTPDSYVCSYRCTDTEMVKHPGALTDTEKTMRGSLMFD